MHAVRVSQQCADARNEFEIPNNYESIFFTVLLLLLKWKKQMTQLTVRVRSLDQRYGML